MTRRTLILGASTVAVGAIALTSVADIDQSAHNFSFYGWSNNQICLPCHTPHNAMAVSDDPSVAPLWNHALTTQTFELYNGTSGEASLVLDTRSVLCMSCHDGVTSMDAFGGGGNGDVPMTGDGVLSLDLTDDHPIGADGIYPTQGAEADEFVAPANWTGDMGTLQPLEVLGQMEDVVSCTTCHEPHQRGGFDHMLWQTNFASGLCLTCHIK